MQHRLYSWGSVSGLFRLAAEGLLFCFLNRQGGCPGRECSAPLGSPERPRAMLGVLLRPRSVSFGGPWFAPVPDSAALPCTPAVADAMMNASKAPNRSPDAMNESSDVNGCYFSVSLFIGDRTPFGTVHGRRVLGVTRPGRLPWHAHFLSVDP